MSFPDRSVRIEHRHACAAALLAIALAAPAAAQTQSATASYSLPGVPAGSANAFNPPGSPVPGAADVIGGAASVANSYFFHDYGYTDGAFGSRSSGQNHYGITGTADFQQGFIATGSDQYVFGFAIDAGQLAVQLAPGATGMQSAGLTGIITESIDGAAPVTLFSYASSMSLTSPGATPTYDETVNGAADPPAAPFLSGGAVSLAPGSGEYDWNATTGSIDLGIIPAGDSVTIDYLLTSDAMGTTDAPANGCTLATGAPTLDCGSAVARIGDPAGLNGFSTQPPDTDLVAFDVSVAEPPVRTLLATALVGLVVARRRYARTTLW